MYTETKLKLTKSSQANRQSSNTVVIDRAVNYHQKHASLKELPPLHQNNSIKRLVFFSYLSAKFLFPINLQQQ